MKAIRLSLTALALAIATSAAQAQISDGVIKIGVLSDMSSLYADLDGAGSVLAATMAVEDFGATAKGMKVEIISADIRKAGCRLRGSRASVRYRQSGLDHRHDELGGRARSQQRPQGQGQGIQSSRARRPPT